VTAAIGVAVIVFVWFVLAAPGCGSGDTGTDTGIAPGPSRAERGAAEIGSPLADPAAKPAMLPRWSGSSSS